ncbi:MAG: 50S ribosomal protein L11 methyltransferase [Gemmatimonadetes bacterium]|nr:50S ribosomal protein L11 methyltransferase [Gemmatimonadota bacterium]
MSYSLEGYLAMIADPFRTGAYARALQRVVGPESIVLDLGAGFGYFAILAACYGARHVYAVETSEAIALGPALARANGVADRVTFLQADSRDVELPERANILVEDVRGVLPFHRARFDLLVDARARHLTPDARFVAVRDRVWAAPARQSSASRSHRDLLRGRPHGVDLGALRPFVLDQACGARPDVSRLAAAGQCLGVLELETRSDPSFEGVGEWTISAGEVVDGFLLWFEAELCGGERFSAAPGPAQSVHGCLCVPLRESLAVVAGDRLGLRFWAVPVGSDYTWAWESWTQREAGARMHGPRQTPLPSICMDPYLLEFVSAAHRPRLGREGLRWQAAIGLADGLRSNREIAVALAASPQLGFSSESAAAGWLHQFVMTVEAEAVRKL